jgi:hypothetical protein
MSLRWSEEDLARHLRQGQPAPISEKAFITDLALKDEVCT